MVCHDFLVSESPNPAATTVSGPGLSRAVGLPQGRRRRWTRFRRATDPNSEPAQGRCVASLRHLNATFRLRRMLDHSDHFLIARSSRPITLSKKSQGRSFVLRFCRFGPLQFRQLYEQKKHQQHPKINSVCLPQYQLMLSLSAEENDGRNKSRDSYKIPELERHRNLERRA